MKEININIEGYNVNGICVCCLNYDRKMYYDDDIKECLTRIADIQVPEELTVQVCWECLAAVKNVKKFQRQMLNSYQVLIDYSQKNTFLDSPQDLAIFATTHLSTTTLDNFDSTLPITNSVTEDMKEDLKANVASKYSHSVNEDIKQELDIAGVPFDSVKDEDFKYELDFDDQYIATASSQEQVSSDEDIQLSTLKKKKDKKRVKIKKSKIKQEDKRALQEDSNSNRKLKSRKLLNLPTNIVQLYTMTEEEMWLVRAQDVASEVFQKYKYSCADCILAFNTASLMDLHRKGKHEPKTNKHQCDVCKAYLLTKDNLSVHRSLHLSAYKCTQCNLVTTLKKLMTEHACAKQDLEEHKCSDCDKTFSTKSKLAYHKKVCHEEKPQCDCCGKVFANKITLKYHLKLGPQNKDDKPKEQMYIPCKGCNKVFHSKKSYRSHVVIHNGLTYPCPICGKQFQWKRNLSRHTRAHRERETGTSHECRECGKTFASRDCYNNHMKLSKKHAEPDAYIHECNYCGKKFATKWCMVDHIDWDHLKRVKYQCSVCFKAFKTSKILVAHMNNIHEGKNKEAEGEHLCDICGKSYRTQKRLKGHVWAMHTQRSNTKSYKCKLCAATFLWQTSIYKHVRMMHDNTRNKPGRAPPVKKQESYAEMDNANRMYFHQNVAPVGSMTLSHPVVLGLQ